MIADPCSIDWPGHGCQHDAGHDGPHDCTCGIDPLPAAIKCRACGAPDHPSGCAQDFLRVIRKVQP